VERLGSQLRGLTLELTGPERKAGLARLATMYRMTPTGPSRPAAEGPVQRRVRPHRLRRYLGRFQIAQAVPPICAPGTHIFISSPTIESVRF
jgi:hypothetical protein